MPPDRLDLQVLQALRESQEQLLQRVLLDQLEPQEPRGLQETQGLLEPQEPRGLQETQGQPEPRALPGQV